MDSLHNLTLESAAHLIQVALTPVFLLSGIAALLNVFAGRLARVADRLESLDGETESRGQRDEEIRRLHQRSLLLDVAVVLGTLGAAATCLAIMTLFLLSVSKVAIAGLLLFLLAIAILCTLCSVVAFGAEMLMSSKALRSRMLFHVPVLHFWSRKAR